MTQYIHADSQPGHHTSSLYKEGVSNAYLMIMNSRGKDFLIPNQSCY